MTDQCLNCGGRLEEFYDAALDRHRWRHASSGEGQCWQRKQSFPDCGLSWCENHNQHAPAADRIDLTIMNGDLFDAHQHQPGDRGGDGPFVNLDSERLSPGGKGHKHRIEANGYLVVVTVTPVEPTASRPAARSHGGHR